jgi:hypothetical protein
MVDGSQLIENAGGNDAQMDVLRSGLSQEGFEIQQGDTGRYFWKSRSGEGPQCDTEAEAIDTCFVMNHLVFPFNEDGSLGTKITAGKETAVTMFSKPEGTEEYWAICILGLEFAHSDPGFLVRSNAAFGWIALFSLPHQNLTLVGFSDATLSRANPAPRSLPASTTSECAAHIPPCRDLLEYHYRPFGLLWSTASLPE